MKRLIAFIKKSNKKATHLQGVAMTDGIEFVEISEPIKLEIVEQSGAYYLLRFNESGQCISDTWHMTLSEAKEQASFEFSIGDDGWKEIEEV